MEELLARYAKIPERIRYPAGLALWLVMLALYFFMVRPGQEDQTQALQEQLQKVQSERSEKRTYADDLPRYEARFSELQQSLNTARAMLPDSADVPQFLAQLGNAGRDVGLSIERFEPLEEVYHDFYSEIGFGMQVHGSYHEIAMFVDAVGKFDRIVNVSGISMIEPKLEGEKVTVKGSFVVKTYRSISDEEAATIATKMKGKK